jgi:Skp family chaperone for outer membrane proteins
VRALGLVLALAVASPGAAQDWLPGESLRMAIFNLEVTLDLERGTLAAELDRLQEETERRGRLLQQLQRRLEESRALLEAAGDSAGGAALDQKEAEIRTLQGESAASSERIRALRDTARAREEQIRSGELRLGALRAQLPPPSESLSGLWDVLVMPGGDRAVFSMRQSGTILAGEYLQDGGHHGSLQGTLIDGKVLLSRIDSRQGRSMELEGKVATDGSSIRGSWQSLDVSGGKPDRGLWQARRRPEAAAPGETPAAPAAPLPPSGPP